MKLVRVTQAHIIRGASAGSPGDVQAHEDHRADELVASGLFEYVDPPVQQLVIPPAPPAVPEATVNSDGSVRGITYEEPDEPEAELTRPDGRHGKQAWVEWAVSQGEDPEMAAKLSKADLMSKYGERL